MNCTMYLEKDKGDADNVTIKVAVTDENQIYVEFAEKIGAYVTSISKEGLRWVYKNDYTQIWMSKEQLKLLEREVSAALEKLGEIINEPSEEEPIDTKESEELLAEREL